MPEKGNGGSVGDIRRVCVAFALGTLLVATAATGPANARTYYPNCNFKLRYKPGTIILACGDYNAQLRNLRWYRWRARVAKARGVYRYNDCNPYCAAGHFQSRTARVVLSRKRYCSYLDADVFTRIKVIPRGARTTTQKALCRPYSLNH